MRPGKRGRSVIVVAGEGDHDRKVLQHLVPALHPGPGTCPKVVAIRKPVRLADSRAQLSPRLQQIKRFAVAQADTAELAGVVIHADLDRVADGEYDDVRRRLSKGMRATFTDCPSALALAAYEMEGWLMLFPKAFPEVRAGWRLREADCRRDLAMLAKPKEHLMRHCKPPYRESDSPAIMKAAVAGGHVSARPAGNNRSFRDFADEMAGWENPG